MYKNYICFIEKSVESRRNLEIVQVAFLCSVLWMKSVLAQNDNGQNVKCT